MIDKYCTIRYTSPVSIIIFVVLSCFLHMFCICFIMNKAFLYTKINCPSTKKNYKTITLIPLNYKNSKNVLETKNLSKTSNTATCKQDSHFNIFNKINEVSKNPKIKSNANNYPDKSIQDNTIKNNNRIISADSTINLISDTSNKEDCIPHIIRYFHPKYPNTAKLLGIEGKVNVIYNINIIGKIEKIRILPTASSGIFEESIKLAMRQWIYKKDQPQQNLTVIFKFSLNNMQITTN